MTPAAIFFDLDGTLCQPRRRFAEVFAAASAPLCRAYPVVDQVTLLAAWGRALAAPGPSTTAMALTQALTECATAPVDALRIADCAAMLNHTWAAAQQLAPAARETLHVLGEHYPLGLITNGPADAQRAVIAALELTPHFRWIVVSGDAEVGVRKPDAAIFHHALALADVQAQAAWYVGDSLINDIGGAAGAGLRTCWLAPDDAPLAADAPQPHARIRRLSELRAILLVHPR
ncbi:MAG: HAD family hydrolase [Ktedonobacterales bacterium]